MVWFARPAKTKYHRLRGLNNTNVLSHPPRSQEPKIKVSAGWVSSEALRQNLFQASLPAPGGLLAIFGVSWLVEASVISAFIFHVTSLWCGALTPNFPFYKDIGHVGLRPTLIPHFNLMISVKTLSPNKVTF